MSLGTIDLDLMLEHQSLHEVYAQLMLVLLTNVQRINTSIQNALNNGYEHTPEELKRFEDFKTVVETK